MNASAISDRPTSKPFTRVMTTPPAWPWDQTRAARLEAHHTSPVSGGDITILVRRLKPWAFNEPGEFVAVYVRAGDAVGDGIDIEVQGRRVRVELPSRAKRDAMLKERAVQIGCVVVLVLAFVGLTMLALQRRASLEERIAQAEVRVQRLTRQSQGLLNAKADARALAAIDVKGQTIDQVISDLNRVSMSMNEDARIEAFYWRKGYWAVEARGEEPPVRGMDGDLQKSVKPVRRGVWIWAAKSGGQRP
jgi:hypothetical protein